MELIIYDGDLFRKGIVENHTSVIWIRKYYEPGTFEIHAPLTKSNINLFQKGYLISKKGTIETGIIESLSFSDSFNKKEIIVKGRFLSSLLDRRVIKGTLSFSGKTSAAMKKIVSDATKIPYLEVSSSDDYAQSIIFQATYKNVLIYETKLAKSSGIGFRVSPDFRNRKLYFEIYQGLDRSETQSDRSRVIFSDEYGNLSSTSYSWNNQLLKNVAYVGGEGEGTSRKYVVVGDTNSIDVRELFVDAKDIRSDEMSVAEYESALKQRGIDALNAKIESESFDSVVSSYGNFTYKKDFDLGDIVTVYKSDWNMRENKRITEVIETYEHGGMNITLTLGTTMSESIDWSDN